MRHTTPRNWSYQFSKRSALSGLLGSPDGLKDGMFLNTAKANGTNEERGGIRWQSLDHSLEDAIHPLTSFAGCLQNLSLLKPDVDQLPSDPRRLCKSREIRKHR